MKIFNSKGDTLVEVTIALAILATVLVSAFLLSSRALRLQQSAKERAAAAQMQQEQAEALRNFRDDKGWGILRTNMATYLDTTRIFYMEPDGTTGWRINTSNTAKTSGFFTMSIRAQTVIPNQKYRFRISTTWNAQGGGTNRTSLTTYLADTSSFSGGP